MPRVCTICTHPKRGEIDAALLDVQLSPSTLRRYAAAYEDVHESLPRDRQGRRLWTSDALDRLTAARELLEAGVVGSIKAGLERALHPPDLPERVTPDRDDLLIAMFEELKTLRQEVQEFKQKQLEPGETQRLNAYLLGELERRRLEAEAEKQRRPWWAFWRR